MHFFNYVMRKVWLHQTRIGLSLYDVAGLGYLRENVSSSVLNLCSSVLNISYHVLNLSSSVLNVNSGVLNVSSTVLNVKAL